MPDYAARLAETTEESLAFRAAIGGEWMSGARKRKRLDAVKHPFVGEGLQGDEDKPDARIGPKLPLKRGGGQMEVGWAAGLGIEHA